jgi:adenylate cyclase
MAANFGVRRAHYSRLPGADEDRILARLWTLRRDLIDPTIAVHHSRIVKRTATAASSSSAAWSTQMNLVIEVQMAKVERNAEVAPDKRIQFRIGIHLGDTVEESDGDLMGDDVNIAARLEGVALVRSACLTTPIGRSDRGSTPRSAISARSTSRTRSRAGARLFARGRPAGLRSCRLPS